MTGGPGTGKTVVALHRALHLARQLPDDAPDESVLLTTYTRNLAADLRRGLRSGRGTALSPLRRAQVWRAVEGFTQELRRAGEWTCLQVCAEATRLLEQGEPEHPVAVPAGPTPTDRVGRRTERHLPRVAARRPGRTRPTRPRRSRPSAELTPVKLSPDPGRCHHHLVDTPVATKHW